MRPFSMSFAASLPEAIAAASRPHAALVAGGTELLNWMKEGIVAPEHVVDVNGVPGLAHLDIREGTLHIGALARMSEVGEDARVRQSWPALSQALLASASPQIRNMASMGGNLLQKTRCPYFRAEVELACNKRRPGSGCAALGGEDRHAALFGWSDRCIATHPSDAAVALSALDAQVRVAGPLGERTIPIGELHRLPGATPERDTTLSAGEVIIELVVPGTSLARRSYYLKVRERASYEFALVSAAACIALEGATIRDARLALGGVAPRPWRLTRAERLLAGVRIDDAAGLRRALEADFADARAGRHNGFKVELAQRSALRALQMAAGVA